MVISALIITFILNKKDYVVFFAIWMKLNRSVMKQLQESKIDYKYQQTEPLIPKEQESLLQMQ